MSALSRPEPDSGDARTSLPPQLLHDLRSPLNQIIGYSEMLAEGADEQPRDEVVADLESIRAAGQRILSLLETHFTADEEPVALSRAAADPAGDEPAAEAGLGAGVGGMQGFLLVVDDDAANRDVLSRRLQRQGHDVTTASNGPDALRLMRESTFDVVLLDIMMPEMDGYEVLGHIKTDHGLEHIPVIMISALHEVQSVVRCIEAGAEDYLTKPFNATLLKARIGASLEKKRGRDRETALFEQVEKNYARLQEMEKLRDDMRNMIVHDLRTPLAALIMGIEMVGRQGPLNDSQREMMNIAIGGGKTLVGLINDLLDVEKMEAGPTQLQYEELSAATLLAGALVQVAALAEEARTVLVTDIAAGLAPFRGDENKLGRTLVNLIANAVKFTQAGTVTIAVSQDAADTRFAVRDTGAGIPAEAFERIFEKFGQLDSHNKIGTGLGLAFCKLAVEAHGGCIAVESTPGAGSIFSFTIPRVYA